MSIICRFTPGLFCAIWTSEVTTRIADSLFKCEIWVWRFFNSSPRLISCSGSFPFTAVRDLLFCTPSMMKWPKLNSVIFNWPEPITHQWIVHSSKSLLRVVNGLSGSRHGNAWWYLYQRMPLSIWVVSRERCFTKNVSPNMLGRWLVTKSDKEGAVILWWFLGWIFLQKDDKVMPFWRYVRYEWLKSYDLDECCPGHFWSRIRSAGMNKQIQENSLFGGKIFWIASNQHVFSSGDIIYQGWNTTANSIGDYEKGRQE